MSGRLGFERQPVAVHLHHDGIVSQHDRPAAADHLDTRIAQSPIMGIVQFVAAFRCDQRDVGGIAAQKQRFIAAPIAGAEHRDPAVGDFISVADRAVAQPAIGQRLLMRSLVQHRGTPVHHARRQQDRTRGNSGASHRRDEPIAVPHDAVDPAIAQIGMINACLLAHPHQQVVSRYAIGKTGVIACQRDQARATLPCIDHRN